MEIDRKVKDIIVDIFDFPHVPYWFTVRQAIKIMKVTLPTREKTSYPLGILVFDEKYNLLGMVSMKDILRAKEAGLPKSTAVSHMPDGYATASSTSRDGREVTKYAEKAVSEVMTPLKCFVEPDDPVTKAAYLMIDNDLMVMPVLERKKKLVGLVLLTEVFDQLCSEIQKG
ncbi:MAG TPA: CBS domain-containing protein [Thermodesulfovibrionales bacterium]|nr:CBS domain-containing protein [Thermodesulfovibrionales bacterium]